MGNQVKRDVIGPLNGLEKNRSGNNVDREQGISQKFTGEARQRGNDGG